MQRFLRLIWRLLVLAVLAVASAAVTMQNAEKDGGPSTPEETLQLFLFMTGIVWAITLFYWYRKDKKAAKEAAAKQARDRESRIEEQVEVARRVASMAKKDGE